MWDPGLVFKGSVCAPMLLLDFGKNSIVNLYAPFVTLAVDNSPARFCLLRDSSSFRDVFSVYSLRLKISSGVLRSGADEQNTTRRRYREKDLRTKIFTTRQLCVEKKICAEQDLRNALRSSSTRAMSCAHQNTDVFEMLVSIMLLHSVEKQLY